MNCSEVHYYGPLYHSGELEEPFLQDFQQHLEMCGVCDEILRRERAADEALRLASDELLDSVRVREQVLTRIKGDRIPSVGFRLTPAYGLAGITILLFLVFAAAIAFRPTVQTPLTIYRDAADDHRAEVVEHMKLRWAQDDATILALLKSVGATEDVTEEITPAGFHLDRARLCRLLNHKYVHLVYSDGHREVSYFLRSREGETLTGSPLLTVNGKAIYVDTIRDLSVAGFQSSKMTVLLVSDEPPKQVLDTVAFAADKF
jgi:hypothetical protein